MLAKGFSSFSRNSWTVAKPWLAAAQCAWRGVCVGRDLCLRHTELAP